MSTIYTRKWVHMKLPIFATFSSASSVIETIATRRRIFILVLLRTWLLNTELIDAAPYKEIEKGQF